MYLFVHTKNPIFCISIYGIATVVLAVLLNSGFIRIVLLAVVISFLLRMGIFAVLDYLDGTAW